MTFEPAAVGVKYYKPVELPGKGEYFIGKYKETFEGKYGKNHKFFEKDGGCVVVNGCGSLNTALENVEPGTWVALSYLGKKKLVKGQYAGKDFNDISVHLCKEPPLTIANERVVGNAIGADEIPY